MLLAFVVVFVAGVWQSAVRPRWLPLHCSTCQPLGAPCRRPHSSGSPAASDMSRLPPDKLYNQIESSVRDVASYCNLFNCKCSIIINSTVYSRQQHNFSLPPPRETFHSPLNIFLFFFGGGKQLYCTWCIL